MMNKLLKITLTILLVLTVYIIQFLVIDSKSLFGIKPNLILVLCVGFSIYFGMIGGGIFSIITGIFLDLLYGTTGFGIYTFLYSVVGITVGKIKDNFKENIFSAIYIMVISCIIFEVLQSLALLFSYKVQIGLFLFVSRTILYIILNSGFMAVIYSLINKILNIEKRYDSF